MLNLTNIKALGGAALIAAAAVFSTPANAANEAMLDLLKILRDKGSISQDEYTLLRNAAMADAEKSGSTKRELEEKVDQAAADMPAIKTDGKLEISSGDWKWRIGGRLMHDATWWSTDPGIGDDPGVADYEDGHEFRRARLYASGSMGPNWDFKLQYDFTDADASQSQIEDAYIRYKGFPVRITVGQQKAPFSLDEMTSSKYITFIERSSVTDAFSSIVGNRRPGITGKYARDGFTLEGGGYLGYRSSNDGEPTALGGSYGFSGRATWAPIREADRSVHLGGSFGWRNLSGDVLRVRARPEVHLADRPVDQDGVAGDSVIAYGVEAAGVYGPFSAQAEYMGYDLDGVPGGLDASGDGFYVYGSYFLTGESRNYEWDDGAFGSIKPGAYVGRGGIGAWEIGVRWSTVDLDDTGIAGGSMDTLAVALNWYATKNIMWKLNYVNVLDCNSNCEDGFGPDANASAVTLRSQFYW